MKKPSLPLQQLALNKAIGCLSVLLILFLIGCGTDTPQSLPRSIGEHENQDPEVAFIIAPTSITGGQLAILTVVASDPDGDVLTFTWEVSGGSISGKTAEARWFAPMEPGRYTLSVSVADGKGGTSQENVEVVVTPPEFNEGDLPPIEIGDFFTPVIRTVWASPTVLTADQTSTVTVEAADLAFRELQYAWRATGGQLLPTALNPDEAEGTKMTWQPPKEPGTYTLTVVVFNDEAQVEDSIQIQVVPAVANNRPPKIQSFEVQPRLFVRGGETVSFNVSAVDPDGDTLTYFWNRLDGTMAGEGTRVQWTAPLPTSSCCNFDYTLTCAVTISDGKGGSDTATITMTVFP